MNLIEKYDLKVGDKIKTDGNGASNLTTGCYVEGIIENISSHEFLVTGNKIMSGGSFPVKRWRITTKNGHCYVEKIFDTPSNFNKIELKKRYGK